MLQRLRRFYRAFRGMALANPSSHETIPHQFERHARDRGDVVFLRFKDRAYTYREANALVNKHASAYKALGLQKGDVVAIFMNNRPEFLWHFLAAGKLGVVASLINTHNAGRPLSHSIEICQPKLVACGSELAEQLGEVAGELDPSIRIVLDQDPDGPADGSWEPWSAHLEGASEDNPPETGTQVLGDLAGYIYTSGTTGLPKAALVRHLRLYGLGQGLGALGWELRDGDVIYNCLPLYHTNGIGVCTGSVITHGVTMALAPRFSASRFWDDVRKYEATGFIYIGELCRYLMNAPEKPNDRDHKIRAICGNGLRPDIWVPFQERFGITKIREFYGSTEGNVGTLNFDDTVGSVGRLLWGGALAKWDEENEDFARGPEGFLVRCKPGEPGVLLGKITNKARFDGYRDSKATNKKIIRDAFKKGDAWFNTGDLLKMDRGRHLFFVDRMGDTFRWKGENVSTFEVQEQLSSWFPAAEINVYGVHIEGTEGRAGMASVVLKDGEAFDPGSFKHHVDDRLPAYARPLFVRVREELETTGTLKLKKTELRDEGFDPNRVEDPVYFRHPDADGYVELSEQLYKDVVSGKLKL